jgi:O-acetyl-ADP-ribose deacetylase (regulator of RNase III)
VLRSCYTSALGVADELGAATVAFPLISSGIYRWPVDDAVRQALTAFGSADTRVELARLMLFDARTREVAEAVRASLG